MSNDDIVENKGRLSEEYGSLIGRSRIMEGSDVLKQTTIRPDILKNNNIRNLILSENKVYGRQRPVPQYLFDFYKMSSVMKKILFLSLGAQHTVYKR